MAKVKKEMLRITGLAGKASMFCLGLAAMVVLAVVFAVVMATMLAATVVPSGGGRS